MEVGFAGDRGGEGIQQKCAWNMVKKKYNGLDLDIEYHVFE
jgi:hypothetical protein